MSTSDRDSSSQRPPRPRAEKRAHSLSEQTSRVADEVRELGSLAVAGAGEALQTVKDRGSEMLDSAKETGYRTLQTGRERFDRFGDQIADHFADHPWRSLFVVLGIGFLYGYTRRRS